MSPCSRDDGEPAAVGELGELVCRTPFPSVPLGFVGDEDGSRLRAAYFDRFPGVWAHGDFAERTASGGFVIHGRSDATLNANGVRIGTAEIYRIVEGLDEITEALAVGQAWDGDTRIVLFVTLAPGADLDDALTRPDPAGAARAGEPASCARRDRGGPGAATHPQQQDRRARVADTVNGRTVRDTSALANAGSLDWFADWTRRSD